MTDEEMAGEYAGNISGLDINTTIMVAENKTDAYRLGIYEGFLAGLKAGRPQWHDLRKDPNDLPKDNNEVLVYMWDSYYIGYFNLDSWHFENFSEGKEQADAWCEIPTYDKE